VVLHEDRRVVEKCKELLESWLKDIGLEFKESKTQIVHTLKKTEKEPGFNFLGFQIRQFQTSKYKSGNDSQGNRLCFKTIIQPSKEAINRHHLNLKEVISQHKGKSQTKLIQTLTPKIRGWCNYYRAVCSSETFYRFDLLIWQNLWAWAKRRHPNKGKYWITNKYWKTVGNDRWVFANNGSNPLYLIKHGQIKIVRHEKVKVEASPLDGNWIYWATRIGKHPELSNRVAWLLKWQQGKCSYCKLFFKDEDLMEIDHMIPKSLGGLDIKQNLQLLHRHCHDIKTQQDGSLKKRYE
jgi:RNA-directed DNA polymerase